MANVSRKAIAAGLLAQIAPTGSPFGDRVGRRIADPENAASPGKPALFLLKVTETIEAGAEGRPPERTLHFTAVIYTDVGTEAAAVPADIIDDLVDYVTVQLAINIATGAPLFGQKQTLGGAVGVYDCFINGTPQFAPGDKDGKGRTLVPITVTLGQYP
jgi:hypothetical protein